MRILPDGFEPAHWHWGKAGDPLPQTACHALTPLPSAVSSFTLSHIFLFPLQSSPAPLCPPDLLLLSLSPHLIFASHPILPLLPSSYPSFLSLPTSPHLFAYPNRSYSVLPYVKARAKTALSPPHSPQPPHSPTGGDRALPSDYTGGAGLEYSPEGRQLSISDNCRERDTHTRVHTHAHALPYSSSCSFVNQGAIT